MFAVVDYDFRDADPVNTAIPELGSLVGSAEYGMFSADCCKIDGRLRCQIQTLRLGSFEVRFRRAKRGRYPGLVPRGYRHRPNVKSDSSTTDLKSI